MGIRDLKINQIDVDRFDAEKASPIEIMIAAGTFEKWRNSLTEDEKTQIDYMWEEYWARPNQKEPIGDYAYWLLLLGRGGGKRLAINTEIPTPDGFKMMGSIKVGDKVFDEDGNVCNVTFVSDICGTPDLYKVIFNNGSYVYADNEHQWYVHDYKYRKAIRRYKNPNAKPRVVTTEEIRDNLYDGKTVNFAVPVTKPVKYRERKYPLEPYLVGIFLSQSAYRRDELIIRNVDIEIVENLRKLGYKTRFLRDSDNLECATYKISHPEYDVLERIEHLELRFRRIPKAYLQGSIEQRKQLLIGMMDGMGHCRGTNNEVFAEFRPTEMALKSEFIELLCSLGIKVKNNPKNNVVDISFCEYPLFSLKRKLKKNKSKVKFSQNYLHIIGVEKVSPIPARCITVDSPNGVYLCTRFYIPTHNTRTGAEWIRKRVEKDGAMHIALVARSPAEAVKVMVNGPAGIISVSRPDFTPKFVHNDLTLTWPNGAKAYVFSSFEPDKLRGPQFDTAWCDELAAWKYLDKTWDNLIMGLRLNQNVEPRCIITTTPRPLPIIKNWVAESLETNSNVQISYGSTYENTFLPPSVLREFKKKYEGTKIGEQELYGRILGDAEGALWSISNLELHRIDLTDSNYSGRTEFEKKWNFITDNIIRIVVSIDPSVGAQKDDTGANESCETGIIVAGLGKDGHGYLLEDCSRRGTPNEWARTAVNAYHRYKADRIVAETNQGGDIIEALLRTVDDNISYKKVFGKKGKYTRAEPVSALYEQGKIHHVGSSQEYEKLENQMINWLPGDDSPDRLDAMVWAFLELMIESGPSFGAVIEQTEDEERPRRKRDSLWDDTRIDLFDGGGDISSLW